MWRPHPTIAEQAQCVHEVLEALLRHRTTHRQPKTAPRIRRQVGHANYRQLSVHPADAVAQLDNRRGGHADLLRQVRPHVTRDRGDPHTPLSRVPQRLAFPRHPLGQFRLDEKRAGPRNNHRRPRRIRCGSCRRAGESDIAEHDEPAPILPPQPGDLPLHGTGQGRLTGTARPAPVALQGVYLDPPDGPTKRLLHGTTPFLLPAPADRLDPHRQNDQVDINGQHLGKDLDQRPIGPSRAAPAPIKPIKNRDSDHTTVRADRNACLAVVLVFHRLPSRSVSWCRRLAGGHPGPGRVRPRTARGSGDG